MKETKSGAFPVGFKVRGGIVPAGSTCPAIVKCIKVLDALPFKELVTNRQLTGLTGISLGTIQQHGADPSLEPYKFKRIVNYWGSKKTIAELKRQMESE